MPTLEVPVEVAGNRYAVRLDVDDVPAAYGDANGVEVLVEAQTTPCPQGHPGHGLAGPRCPRDADVGLGRRAQAGNACRTGHGPAATAAAGCDRKWNKTSKTWTRRVKVSDVMPAAKYMKGTVRYKSGTSRRPGTTRAPGWSTSSRSGSGGCAATTTARPQLS